MRAAGRAVPLSVHEHALLVALARALGRIVRRDELHRRAWGAELRDGDRTVDVYVARVRRKLDAALPGLRCIHTHVGFGYRLEAERAGGEVTGLSHDVHTGLATEPHPLGRSSTSLPH